MALRIAPLTPDRLPDLAALFEQGGDPKWCWCAYFRIRGFDFSSGGKARHRSVLEAAAADGAVEGRAPGLVAYDGDEAVGWISVGPREDYERLAHSRILAAVDDTPVWSIVCFVVGRRSRGKGVARALLTAGIGYAREHGARMLEAYPVETTEGSRIDAAAVYKGTLSMFERAGFEVVARRRSPSGASRPIVRLALSRTTRSGRGTRAHRSASGPRPRAVVHRPGLLDTPPSTSFDAATHRRLTRV
ncbi:MAG: GNAT family N-acetyltransferase, partial [Candidatus Limnocylindrales bacterium]